MSDADYEWRTRLRGINLVVEADFTAEEIWTAQKKYGAASQYLLNRPRRLIHDEIIQKYPALTLVILVGHASLGYDQGRYWESFWEELDRSEEHTSELQSRGHLVCRLLLEKKKRSTTG